MAARVQELCRTLVDAYGGRADGVWKAASSGAELLTRVRQLPGFGEQKAKIFVALLGKQFGVRPSGWREASAPYGDPDTFRSVADITDTDSLDRVRAFKQEMKAHAKAAAATKAAGTKKGAPATKPASTGKSVAAGKTAGAKKAAAPKAAVSVKKARGSAATTAGAAPKVRARAGVR